MYSKSQEFLLLLDSLGISKAKILKFFEAFESHENLVECFHKNPNYCFNEKEICDIKTAILMNFGLKTAQKLEKMQIFCIFINSDDYPGNLKNITNPPVVLYCKGDARVLKNQLISIVGSRMPTRYGKEVTEHFASELAKAGLVTVSGLAYGVDGIVASASIECGGKTIAVLAGGLDKIYPANHEGLARRIVESGGLLISEYLPGVAPQKHFFLERNRIVAGLSSGLVVTEAGKKSGTLSTASHAINFGRELFVIPGNITSPKSVGTNGLIAAMPHAFTVSPSEVFERLGIKISNQKTLEKQQNLTNDERKIIDILYIDEKHFDELVEISQIDPKTLATLLTRMEINGLIKKLSGNFYAAVRGGK